MQPCWMLRCTSFNKVQGPSQMAFWDGEACRLQTTGILPILHDL